MITFPKFLPIFFFSNYILKFF